MQQVRVEQETKLAEYVSQAEAGEDVVLLRDGKPVAKIIPFHRTATDAEREAAIARMGELMEKGMDLGGIPPRREDLYGRI